jgi:D-alanine-D-alanine ligase
VNPNVTDLRRVVVLYNTDYDDDADERVAGADVSAVRMSAMAVCDALKSEGLGGELLGIHGRDLAAVLPRLQEAAPDLVFNLCESLHGDSRNEVVMPAVLDLFGLRYTGSDSFGLALCLHKPRTKEALHGRGIPTPPYLVLGPEDEGGLDDRRDLDELAYPYFLKLAHEDASVGIDGTNVVHDRAALVARVRALIKRWDQAVIAERYIAGREVNATVLGSGAHASLLPLHEIDFAAMPDGAPHIVSYAAKWDEKHAEYAGTRPVPMAGVDDGLAASIRRVALGAFAACGLRDYGRVDLRVDAAGVPWVIDVNPNCDISPDAGVARAGRAAGLDYPQLIRRLCELAWRRYAEAAGGTGR